MAQSDCRVGGLGLALLMIIVASAGPEPALAAGVIDTGNVTCSPSVASCPSGNLQIGNTADGTRTVDAVASGPFGTVSLGNNTGVSGTLDVINAGSFGNAGNNAVQVGANGTGVVTISGGGQVSTGVGATAGTFDNVGLNAGSSGSLTITGPGSAWTSNNGLTVGFLGSGSVMAQSAGGLNVNGTFTGSLSVGGGAGAGSSSATVTGAGSQITVLRNSAIVGSGHNATLSVLGGGALNAPRLVIASNVAGVLGTVNVSGAGSQITLSGLTTFVSGGVNHNNIAIGFGGTGVLNITGGGKVLAEPTVANHQASMSLGGVNAATGVGGTGTVTVSGAGSELRLRGNTTAGSTLVGFIDGRLEKLGSAYPVLTEVYYVQTQVNPEAKQVANTLVKRGKEWHAPERMILNASHILLVEPVTPDSTVAKLIDELKKQK